MIQIRIKDLEIWIQIYSFAGSFAPLRIIKNANYNSHGLPGIGRTVAGGKADRAGAGVGVSTPHKIEKTSPQINKI